MTKVRKKFTPLHKTAMAKRQKIAATSENKRKNKKRYEELYKDKDKFNEELNKQRPQDLSVNDRFTANMKMFEVFARALQTINQLKTKYDLLKTEEKIRFTEDYDKHFEIQEKFYKEELEELRKTHHDLENQSMIYAKLKDEISSKNTAQTILDDPLTSDNTRKATENLIAKKEKSINELLNQFKPQCQTSTQYLTQTLPFDHKSNTFAFSSLAQLNEYLDVLETPEESLYRKPLELAQTVAEAYQSPEVEQNSFDYTQEFQSEQALEHALTNKTQNDIEIATSLVAKKASEQLVEETQQAQQVKVSSPSLG